MWITTLCLYCSAHSTAACDCVFYALITLVLLVVVVQLAYSRWCVRRGRDLWSAEGRCVDRLLCRDALRRRVHDVSHHPWSNCHQTLYLLQHAWRTSPLHNMLHMCFTFHFSHCCNNIVTRSTQRAQPSAERQQSSESGFRTSDSWIRMVIRIVTKIYPLGPWAMPYPPRIFVNIRSQRLQLSDRQTGRQTDRQTDWTKNITSFGRGNNHHIMDSVCVCLSVCLSSHLTSSVMHGRDPWPRCWPP